MPWTCYETMEALMCAARSLVRMLSIKLKCEALNWERVNVRW
jgi:hypothetical protein